MNNLKDKWALVTGSTRGIGQQIAIGLAEKGCNIVVHGRKIENTKKTEKLLSNYDIKTSCIFGELGTGNGERNIIDFVLKEIGYIDILYNNAAIMGNW